MENFTKQPLGNSSLDQDTRDKISPAQDASPAVSGLESQGTGFFAKNKWFVLVFVLAIVVIGILTLFIFRKPNSVKEGKVTIDLVVPSEVPSSGEAVVRAVVSNNDSTTLTHLELEMVYPSGTVFVSSNPEAKNLSGTLYSLPDISPGANVATLIKLKFEGGVGTNAPITARLKYSLAGSSASFTKEQQTTAKLVAAGVSVELQGPVTATNAQLVSYTVHYANQSTEGFDRVRVKLGFPSSFQFASATPASTQGTDTWDIGQLAPTAEGTITVSGTFLSASLGQGVTVNASVLVPDKNGGYYVQAESQFSTSISTQPLVVTQSLDNGEQTSVADPGNTLQYKLSYQNNASVAARGVRIVMTIDSATMDTSTVQAEGALVSGNTITWSAASKSELEVVNPNEAGTVLVSFRIKDPPVKDRSINPDVITNVKIKSDEYDTFLPGNKMQVKIATKARLEGTVAFVDGQKPPRVGQQSRYSVSISVKNTTSDVTGSDIVMFVATGAGSFDKATVNKEEANAVSFDTSTGKLVWHVATLKAHVGEFSPARILQFTLRAVPGASQAGLPLPLVKNIIFTGTNDFTAQTITKSITQLTTSDTATADAGGIVIQ